jgi:nitrogen-specific signal transduction histidine kinase
MRIAVIGGGTRCQFLIELLEHHAFEKINPVIIAVADINPEAPGFIQARKKGIDVTIDYNDILNRDDIDLIIELTGNLDVYADIISKKKDHTHTVAHKTALLFWEIYKKATTIQKAIKQSLQNTTAVCDMIMNELIQEDILIFGLDHKIINVNNNFLEKLEMKRSEVIGRYCYEITHHQDMPCTGENHPCPLNQLLETGKPSKATHIHLDKNKNERYFSISCYPLRESGQIIGAIEISKDITTDINMHKSLMQQEKMVSIGRLYAGVAHEINNPLTTILTSSMLMQEDTPKESPLYQELEIISNEALRCRKIVKSLLDFARQAKSSKKMCNLNDIIKESYILTRKQAAFSDIKIQTDLQEGLPKVNIDEDQIQQTLINLILNAIEATSAGGTVTLSSRYIAETDKVEVVVSDTGIGIPPENIDSIFEPFFTTRDNGTGLGLSISLGIIEQHCGKIMVQSVPGEGTQFTIQLPRNRESNDGR